MKRDDLKNLGLTDEQVESVMTMNGADITREQGKATSWKDQYDTLKAQTDSYANKYANYDNDMEELASLRAYKDGVEFDKRFTAVLGDNKPVNDMTRKGLSELFSEAVKDPANDGKNDGDIFSKIVGGKEQEYFGSRFTVNMTPSANRGGNNGSYESFLDERYSSRK